MITARQVPDEVWFALKDFVRQHPYGYDYREAIAAAINAWPGGKNDPSWDLMTHEKRVSVILPLPPQKEGR